MGKKKHGSNHNNKYKNKNKGKANKNPQPSESEPKSSEYEEEFPSLSSQSSIPVKKNQKKQKRQEQFHIPNKGLENLGNSCFANALFQCLFHVTAFRDSIIEASSSEEKTSNSLLQYLADFFKEMGNKSNDIRRTYRKFLNAFSENRSEFNFRVRGDSSMLLRALFEELSKQKDTQILPYLQIFTGGDLTKTFTCPQETCKKKKILKETIKILEVRDVDFIEENIENFFQPQESLRRCSCSEEKQTFSCEYIANELPEILIMRIHDTFNSNKTVKILPNITLQQYSSTSFVEVPQEFQYEFVASVMNQEKGEQGVHSVELSLHQGTYYIFNDSQVYSTSLDSVDYHPKVIFYKKVTPIIAAEAV